MLNDETDFFMRSGKLIITIANGNEWKFSTIKSNLKKKTLIAEFYVEL